MGLLNDVWDNRDFLVLREAARHLELDRFRFGTRVADIAIDTNISNDQVEVALRNLEDDGLLTVDWVLSPRAASAVRSITGEARRIVGLWPTPAAGLDRMIAALEAIAENSNDEDTRSRARKVLDGFAGAGRELGIAVAAAAITGRMPI